MITGIVMLRHRELCRDSVSVKLLQIGVMTLLLCRNSISVGSCCNNVSCIVSISIVTRKVYCDKVLSPLNLISCCNFILILRHSLLVLSMFSVATKFLCCDKNFCIQLIFVFRPSLLCRDKTSLPCVRIFIAT